jgi:hypothetical protein
MTPPVGVGFAPPPHVHPDELADALACVGGLWSNPSTFSDTQVHHGYRQVTVVLGGVLAVPALGWLVEQFAPVTSAWLSRIEPGGFIVEHVDAGPYLERWQVPFTEGGTLFDNGNPVTHAVGVPFRVRQYDWHSVRNESLADRIALVIDRAVPLDVPTSPFRSR